MSLQPSSPTGFEGPLAEFVALRSEMELRGKYQNQIASFQLTIVGAVFSFALTRPDFELSLLIIPISSYLLCGRYAAQRSAIRRIARYISDELSPRVPGGLGWEQRIRAEPRRGRFLGWLLPFVLAFPGASVVALGWTSDIVRTRDQLTTANAIPIAVWCSGALGTLFSLFLLLRIYLGRR